MKTLIFLVASAVLAQDKQAKDKPAKLTDEQSQLVNQLSADYKVADLERQIAELKMKVSSIGQTLVIHDACWEAGIKPSDCSPQGDRTLAKKKEQNGDASAKH